MNDLLAAHCAPGGSQLGYVGIDYLINYWVCVSLGEHQATLILHYTAAEESAIGAFDAWNNFAAINWN